MHFVILGIHEPGVVPGVSVLTARVRIFPYEDEPDQSGVTLLARSSPPAAQGERTFVDDDIPLPELPGFQHTMSSVVTRHLLKPLVEAKVKAA